MKSKAGLQPLVSVLSNAAVALIGMGLFIYIYLWDEGVRTRLILETSFSDEWLALAAERDSLFVALWVVAGSFTLAYIATSIWCGIAIGKFAASKDRNAGAFGLLGFFWPLVGFLIVNFMRTQIQDGTKEENRFQVNDGMLAKCPECAELIRIDARRCRFCNFDVETVFLELRRQLGLN